MAFRSIELLQFDELLSAIAGYAGSAPGKELVLGLAPHRDLPALESDLADAGEAIVYLREAAGSQDGSHSTAVRLRFDRLPPVEPCVRILKVEGASLDGRQIQDLLATLAIAGEYRSILQRVASRFPRLAG
ncbi:MAG TPA: endonuclease MutS2, partial [Bryobacteraceae bacterium]|nr:endonuclease MutS2 [Bryobacteraceae bacterium]